MIRRLLELLLQSTPEPRYCGECGAQNDPNATYCAGCGKMMNP